MTDPDARIAIIVVPSLPLGLVANTVAAIGIGIGASRTGLGNTVLRDCTGRAVETSANRPVPILQAPADVLCALLLKATPAPDGCIVVPFPRFARDMHRFDDYLCEFPRRDLAQETIDGLGLAGSAKWVTSLTGNLKLLR